MKNKVINIPNTLTVIRFLLAFVFLYLIINSKTVKAITVLLIAIFTDILDGYLARKLNQESKFGRVFDSTVDTTFFLIVLISLSYHNYIETLITTLIISAGTIIIIAYAIQKEITPTYWSKASALFIYILIIFSLFQRQEYDIIKWPVVILHMCVGFAKLYIAFRSKRKV